MVAPDHWWLVRIEFGRVQGYLFLVSELKAKLGGNTLLGEVLRGRIRESGFLDEGRAKADNFPALVKRHKGGLPPDVTLADLKLPEQPLDNDPLSGEDHDLPRVSYAQRVLARDGGHFHAVFEKKEAASEFIRDARALAARHLPGLRVKATLHPLNRVESG